MKICKFLLEKIAVCSPRGKVFSLGVKTFLILKGKYGWESNHLLLSGCKRKNQKISIDKNDIPFYSIVIEAEPFSIPAAASGTKASPKVQGENKMLWKI